MEDTNNQPAKEFFNLLVISSVLLFAINNWWLKYQFHNWFTGKLSDLLFCFFFPLYCSAILSLITKWEIHSRTLMGISFTLALFIPMKTSIVFSNEVSNIFSLITQMTIGSSSNNIVDSTDLIVIPVVICSFYIAIKSRKIYDTTQ